MREGYLCTTSKLRTKSFCRQRAWLEVMIKVPSKADTVDGRRAKKVLQKIDFLLYFFNNVTFIKTSNPALCRQKEFVLNLKVGHK